MKSRQFIGPFSNEQLLDLGLSNIKYMQIGAEFPYSVPITEKNPTVVLSINDKDYAITEKDILEFENMNLSQLPIIIKKANDPYIIIDISYE